MSGFIASVDARTQLAGRNRMELLLFRLSGPQQFGINVFKVREVIPCPKLTQVPNSHSVVRGLINIRGNTMSVLDLGAAVGLGGIPDTDKAFLVVTEYNGSVQGFLVNAVDRIVNHNWADILPPPSVANGSHYLTAVTHVDGELVEIIDVERVLSEVIGVQTELESPIESTDNFSDTLILVVDDSSVARKQICRTLEQIGCTVQTASDGQEAYELLENWVENEPQCLERLALIISDIEMPRMDGYTLTSKIRASAHFEGMPIVLHTSLSGGFNEAMVSKVGADEFISKFDPTILADAILRHLSPEEHVA